MAALPNRPGWAHVLTNFANARRIRARVREDDLKPKAPFPWSVKE